MVDAMVWMDQNYPITTRATITELDISNKDLEGTLNLTEKEGFEHLYKLNISFNKLLHFNLKGINDNEKEI
jgi:hypothetical protein